MRAHASDRIGGAKRPRKKRKTRKKSRGVQRWIVRRLLLSVLIVVGLSLAAVLPFRWINPPTTAFMLQDNSGRSPLLHEWSAWSNFGDATPIAVVASEDQKFADHLGFDIKSIRASVGDFNDGAPLRGASTITQQVAKNMYLWPGKNFVRKGIEAWFTLLIEASWPKKRILEIYLNIAEFGPGVYGISSASEFYFNKTPAALSFNEAALLAAVLPNPKQLRADQPTQYLRDRQNWIIRQMQRLQREQWLTLLD